MKIRLIFILLIVGIYAFSQPAPFIYSYSEFYLGNRNDLLTLEQIKNKEIKFYSYKNNTSLKISQNKLFLSTYGYSSSKSIIYIIQKSDTICLNFSMRGFFNDNNEKLKIISIKDFIKLETGYYNFDSELIKSFLYNNNSCNLTENGHCEIFYFDLPKKEKLVINKDEFKYLKEIEIQEEE